MKFSVFWFIVYFFNIKYFVIHIFIIIFPPCSCMFVCWCLDNIVRIILNAHWEQSKGKKQNVSQLFNGSSFRKHICMDRRVELGEEEGSWMKIGSYENPLPAFANSLVMEPWKMTNHNQRAACKSVTLQFPSVSQSASGADQITAELQTCQYKLTLFFLMQNLFTYRYVTQCTYSNCSKRYWVTAGDWQAGWEEQEKTSASTST